MNEPNVIITGSPGGLAGQIAARRVFDSGSTVFCLASPRAFENFFSLTLSAAIQLRPTEAAPSVEDRLGRQVRRSIELKEELFGAEVWHFSRPGDAGVGKSLERLLPTLRRAEIAAFNHVVTPYAGGGDWQWITDRDTGNAAEPDLSSLPLFRSFRTSLTVSPRIENEAAREGFFHFLAVLFDLKTEIEERLPEYFEYRSLRCHAPAGASVNLIRVEQAAELILTIADSAAEGRYVVASPESMPFADLLERVGAAYGLGLLCEEARESLNAVDSLLEARLLDFKSHLGAPDAESVAAGCRIAGVSPHDLVVSEKELDILLDATRRVQQEALENFRGRTACITSALTRREAHRDGQSFTYYSSGEGETAVVVLNALGQGPQYWARLVELLRRRYKVFIWDQRGLDPSSPSQFRIGDHADDLEAVLRTEGVSECHVVAWCTGPKIAVEYYQRHPGRVRSMVFLNTTVKCVGSPAELDTPYERDFEPLCRILDQRPAMAAGIMNSLASGLGDGDLDLDDETYEGDVAADVLARMNAGLRSHVRRPFGDTGTLVNYARQVLDFWEYDLRPKAGEVRVPVLFVCSEYDRVAAPQASEAAAQLFPAARLLHVQGATHYFLYDRPEVTAHLLEQFFEDPDTFLRGQNHSPSAADR